MATSKELKQKLRAKLTEKKGPIKITEVYQEYCTSIEEKPSKASGLFSYVYEDYTVPQTFIWLNLPLANLARSFCLSSLLVAITGRPFHQLSVAMIVEAAIYYLLSSQI